LYTNLSDYEEKAHVAHKAVNEVINERIKKIETHQESFEKKNGDKQTAALADTLQQAQVHTNDKICDEKDRAQEALEAVRDELDDNIKNLGEEHTAFVNDQYNPKVAHLSKRIDIRKSNADKILEAGASAVPHTFFAALKNKAMKPGSGHCETKGKCSTGEHTRKVDCRNAADEADDRNEKRPCKWMRTERYKAEDHGEMTFGQCKCGRKWINHDKTELRHSNPDKEMEPLEESEEAKETDEPGQPAGVNPSVKPAEGVDSGKADGGEHSEVSGDSDVGESRSSGPSRGESDNGRRSDRRLATAELTPSEKALRRRRLSNHPKSHVVVLERLMEEINRLN